MNAIHLLSVVPGRGHPVAREAEVRIELLDDLAAELARIFQVSCHVHEEAFSADFALDPARSQYHSTAILQRMQSLSSEPERRFLGVTELDLHIPVLTFVFGEAQLGGQCALVSLHRLREEFYGLAKLRITLGPSGEGIRPRTGTRPGTAPLPRLALRDGFNARCGASRPQG